jgi:exonuclease III
MAYCIAFQLVVLGRKWFTMNILSWNVRGLGDDGKNTQVYKILEDSRADIICIQETKLSSISRFKVREFLPARYTGYIYQPADGSAGGTLIAWYEKCFTVIELMKNKYSIIVRVESNSDNRKFVLSNVYAPCDSADREDFFEDMRIMKTNIIEPWALAGDFNTYRYVQEKKQRKHCLGRYG